MIFKPSMLFLAAAALARSVYARVAGYEVLAASEVQDRRLEICYSCDDFDEDAGQCQVCGCLCFAKTALSVERCPVGKWNAIWRKKV